MEFYNQLVPKGADSAGTIVDYPGEKLKDRLGAATIVTAMKEVGIDMTENIRTQIRPHDIDKYDQIIVMAEPETIPEWLKSNKKTIIWTIKDAKDQPIEVTRQIRDELKAKVQQLVGR